MSVLKIGVLTFHRCINYGSYWQARSLAEGLQSAGHRVSILDHFSRRVNLVEWKCAFRPVLPTPVPSTDYALYRKKIRSFFEAFESLPLSPPFSLDNPADMEPYDAVVVGSDEVWNLAHPWYGHKPLFYGEGIQAQRLISYAASFGNYPASLGLEPRWAERLRNFEALSVRDENSRLIVRHATGTEPELVLDPCLQFSIRPEERHNPFGQTEYAAVYGHNFSAAFIRQARSWARSRNLPLVSIGYRNDWADGQWIDADPHQFVHFMTRCAAVVTNFFHGCVFALRQQKPFVCEITPYRTHKIEGLMKKVGGERHLIAHDTHDSVLSARLNEPIDPRILQKVDCLRQSSHAFISGALSLRQLRYA